MKTYLSLGSNLGDRYANFQTAIDAIHLYVGEILAVSTFYKTEPLNSPDATESQPEFLNAVLCCETTLTPEEVLQKILLVEQELGRVRKEGVHWGPRLIDIDILAMGDLIIEQPGLTIPHPEMHNRDFVLVPLSEIAPDFIHPKMKINISQMLENLNTRFVKN
ncbi:MAG: 2-amino-4-hydroxy-6-hydroxymethyldihydropteridine diphosphokinase [Deltaproteobacteria bacterium]|nr:2-amino-4-hydroxy-6-hydroxymethyldihydropteridine diphosphokinase [Deltaproteobacteria bacterium]